MGRVIGSVIFAFVFGMLLGYFVVGWFGPLMAKLAWLPGGAASVAVVCGLLFASFAANRQWRRLAWQRERRDFAGRSALRYSANGSEKVVDEIKQLTSYGGATWLENEMQGRLNDVRVTVGDLFHRSSGENSRTTRRTIAHFQGENLYFPHFTMQREGTLLTYVGNLIGVQDLDFPGHPGFSDVYHLSSDEPETTRQLFSDECLEFFAANHGWEIRAERDQIMMTRDYLVETKDLDGFIDQAKAILDLLHHCQEQLLESAKDSSAAAGREPAGSETIGSGSRIRHAAPTDKGRSPLRAEVGDARREGWLARRVQANTVAWEDVERFLQSPPPRDVPAVIRRQRAGLTGLLLIGFLCLFGLMVLPIFVLGMIHLEDSPLAVVGGSGLILIAIIVIVEIVVMKRRSAVKILRIGRLRWAELVGVRSTGWEVNSQPQFHVTFRYDAEGQKRLKTLKVYGDHGALARDAMESGNETALLVDPQSPDHCVLGIQLTNPFRIRL